MKVLVDVNLSTKWVAILADGGLEATHWSTVGRLDAEDAVIMAYAAEHDYVLLTLDLDFGAILAVTKGHKPSVVQVRPGAVHIGSLGKCVIETLRQLTPELESGALVVVGPERTRVRVLPL